MAAAEPATLGDLLSHARQRLVESGSDSPRLDAEVLLRHLLHLDRAHLLVSLDRPAPPWLAGRFDALVERRAAGEPVAYITGQREFMGLDFLVDRRVLIPRPETEFLVEWGSRRLRRDSGRSHRGRLVVDVGTGSGAIIVSLAALTEPRLGTVFVGADISREAIEVARLNAARLAPGRVELLVGNLLSWCRRPADLILANLPYLRPEQLHEGIEREPEAALLSGEDGFDHYRRLLARLPETLAGSGACICEIDPSQRKFALRASRTATPNRRISVLPDLAGFDRYLVIEPR
ncbi:MAG TPA: peptide chain release factor N(5)-glutamine methyltransferase [Thermomicrobiaceae bacterium]|nr:peptide chain release factor N(5)-glutamine methyltransferase [Thermomicrobiaceae bacterium]